MNKRLKLFELMKKESQSLFDGAHNVYTPKELTQAIVNKLELDNKSILVMYNVEFVISLIELFNVDPKSITFYSDHENKTTLMSLFKVSTVTSLSSDSLFDIIISNPPYQHPTNKSIKRWATISSNAYQHLSTTGTMAFVSPSSWIAKPATRGFNKVTRIMKNTLQYVKYDCTEYFPYVGETIGYWIVSKNAQVPVVFDMPEGEVKFDSYELQPVFTEYNKQLANKIKTEFHKGKTVRKNKVIDFYYSNAHAIQRGLLTEIKSKEFNIPVYVSANKTLYTKKELIKSCYKIILNKSGYYFSEKDTRYMLIPNTPDYGVGENAVGIPTASIEQANNAKTLYASKLCRFFIDNEKSSGFNSGLLDLPILDFDKTWTDAELYKLFNLTEDEINYIESRY